MPAALPGIAFDALNNLCSALDQAGYAIAFAVKGSGNQAHFPFGDTLSEVESRIKGPSKDIPKEIFDLMVSFKPYKGGNDLLWALNKLCNSHKHELITPMALTTGRVRNEDIFVDGVIEMIFPPIWNRTKNEMIVAHLRHGTAYKIKFEIQMFIALAKIDVVDGKEAVGILNALLGIVNSIIMAVEVEGRRIGIFSTGSHSK